jgi:hypothetical protein
MKISYTEIFSKETGTFAYSVACPGFFVFLSHAFYTVFPNTDFQNISPRKRLALLTKWYTH